MLKLNGEVPTALTTATMFDMGQDVIDEITRRLAPEGCMDRAEAEAGYPPRKLPDGALVTRLAPSPTGFVHIGTVYTALINHHLARQTSGIFFLRLEDTDKSREVEGGLDMIEDALDYFDIHPDESPKKGGLYGPYIQSQRAPLYMSYALWLLKNGRAYPCFANKDELDVLHQRQIEQKLRPGYYGQYAVWRDKTDAEIKTALQADQPFVLRFKSEGDHASRIVIEDELKGRLELPANDLDVPLIKAGGLPTYHLAHVVDDFLMKVSLVLRGDEWLPSLPLHIELSEALGFEPFRYGHLAPISIMDGQSKRKLSKRKDESANVQYWMDAGYPSGAIIEYLFGLASADFENWRKQNPLSPISDFDLSLKKLAMSRGPLLDEVKLADISRDYIAKMEQSEFENQITKWVSAHDFELAEAFGQDPAYTQKVLTIEREGGNRRKDLARWADVRQNYGYFFDKLFDATIQQAISQELSEVPQLDQTNISLAFLEAYHPNDDQPTWLYKLRAAAKATGYAPDAQTYKSDPAKFTGTLADFAKVVRVKLTGKNRSPDLYSIMQIMGPERVRSRLHG